MNTRSLPRRELLGKVASALPAWMPRLAFRPAGTPPRGDILVSIFQRGGMDGLSAVVPYEERRYFDLRPKIAFNAPDVANAKSSLRLDDRFALNPALTSLKQVWDAGQLAVVHATGAPHGSRSHFDAMDYMERGTPGEKRLNTGWLGRHLSATARREDSPFRAVGFGAGLPQSLHGPVSATSLRSIADFHLQGRGEELGILREQLASLWCGGDWFADDARATLDALDILERADPLRYTPENGATYPATDLGQALKQVAQLIKADVGLEVACVDVGGWDTHVNQVYGNYNDPTRGMMYNLLRQLDDAIGAFWRDMGGRMVDPGVTLVTMSEFGRRVGQNAANGTDHGQGSCMFVVSGAAVPAVHTTWPGLEADQMADGEDLAITRDYRDTLSEILVNRLGNPDLYAVFPDHDPVFHGVVRARADAPQPRSQGPRIFLPSAMSR